MAKHPIDGYPNSGGEQGTKRAATGGMCCDPKDVNKYRPPVGPSNISDPKSPGLHGTNYSNRGTQGRH